MAILPDIDYGKRTDRRVLSNGEYETALKLRIFNFSSVDASVGSNSKSRAGQEVPQGHHEVDYYSWTFFKNYC